MKTLYHFDKNGTLVLRIEEGSIKRCATCKSLLSDVDKGGFCAQCVLKRVMRPLAPKDDQTLTK